EENGIVRIGERRVQIGAPAGNLVLLRQALDLVAVAADDDDVRHQPGAVGEGDAALVADGEDGAHQVLIVAHAPGDPVHDDADASPGHPDTPSAAGQPLITGWLLAYRGRRRCVKQPRPELTVPAAASPP